MKVVWLGEDGWNEVVIWIRSEGWEVTWCEEGYIKRGRRYGNEGQK